MLRNSRQRFYKGVSFTDSVSELYGLSLIPDKFSAVNKEAKTVGVHVENRSGYLLNIGQDVSSFNRITR
jgi:hypothetical protein